MVAVVAMVSLPVMMVALVLMAPAAVESNFELVKGGLNFLSIFTASWEAVYCVSMPVLLLSVFRRRFDSQSRLSRFLSQNAYTVYIIHAPVIVFTALVFRNLSLDPLLKFVLVAPLGAALCFLASHYLVRRLPLADRVL
jgi:surface polysaccharide O-acyltransferase-like enzyme